MITSKLGHKSKNDDCYFYYYGSGCAKGNICPFRHEPAALAQETVCLFWKNGNCSKPNCMFRHMDLSKKRNVIPCYWEKTTTGCQKVILILWFNFVAVIEFKHEMNSNAYFKSILIF